MPTIQQIAQMLGDIIEVKKTACQCLQCDQRADPKRRGLCKYHYDQFYRTKIAIKKPTKKKTLAARKEFDDEAVAQRQILKANPGRRERSPNPYKLIVKKVS